jgi:hypothetical protein
VSASVNGARAALRVEAVFHDVDPRQADMIAAEMVARAHELANRPECECDVDLSIESPAPRDPRATGAAAPATR